MEVSPEANSQEITEVDTGACVLFIAPVLLQSLSQAWPRLYIREMQFISSLLNFKGQLTACPEYLL